MLNRGVVIVHPKQAFLDWADALDDSGLRPGDERTIYLVPEYEDDDEAMEVLSVVYEDLFEAELNGWHTREEDWPSDRTLAKFLEWFKVEFHSCAVDMCAYPLEDDGYLL